MKNKTQGVNVFTDKVPNYGLSLSLHLCNTHCTNGLGFRRSVQPKPIPQRGNWYCQE